MTSEEDSSRQSTVNTMGSNFESHVKTLLNNQKNLFENNICLLDGKEIFADKNLHEKFKIPIRKHTGNYSDYSLIAQDLETKQPIAWIDCSTSLHGRLPLTLFYSLIYKGTMPNLKIAFVTADVGNKKKGSETLRSTEWGSDDYPTKNRAFAEKYLNGVYVDADYLKRVYNYQTNTNFGGIIKKISELATDLLQWKSE